MIVADQPTLMMLWQPAIRWQALAYQSCWMLVGSLLIGISAWLAVPFYPVPMTGQTLVVLLLGAAQGPRLAMGTVALYLLEGALGLPVFSHGRAGPAMLIGPTAGYLFGFLLAAGLVGWLAQMGWDRRFRTTFLAMLIGNIQIYVLGICWLIFGMGVSIPTAFKVGLYPFVIGDLAKICLASLVLPACWRYLGRQASGLPADRN
ncbi:MAG: biotin transporter BioY [Sedimentisphaerales bacterium]|jgi:biotin transport system substrate-specific component|nr:biotin transporter BioY [Sedimentisphaerales bacterium]